MTGKKIRMERIIDRATRKTVIIPMDHGVTVGPIPGLIDMKTTINAVAESGANAIVLHKGVVRAGHREGGVDVGLIIHLSGSTKLSPDPNAKELICNVEEAIKLGADGVSIHINLGARDEKNMLRDMGKVINDAYNWGMPVLAMMYVRGDKIDNEYDPQVVKHAARVGAELGADVVKVSYTGSSESFREVVEGCFVPVVIAGGEKMDTDEDILTMVKGSIDAGGAGVSIGRNVFQHRSLQKIVNAISSIVHKNISVDKAIRSLKESQ